MLEQSRVAGSVGWVRICDRRTKINWTRTACRTPLSDYGLSIGPYEGLTWSKCIRVHHWPLLEDRSPDPPSQVLSPLDAQGRPTTAVVEWNPVPLSAHRRHRDGQQRSVPPNWNVAVWIAEAGTHTSQNTHHSLYEYGNTRGVLCAPRTPKRKWIIYLAILPVTAVSGHFWSGL